MAVGVVLDPADVRIGQRLTTNLNTVLGLEAALEYLKLQHADHAHNDALHAGTQLAEDLDGALLGKLLHALHELLCA